MALMERVATLLRANVNDLIDRAENPEKMLRQLLLDMENHLVQVKTQVAIAIADEHLLEKKRTEHLAESAEWKRKAELAVAKSQDDLARAALERSIQHQHLAEGFAAQAEEQKAEADALRTTFRTLESKFKETQAQCEMLSDRARRARMVSNANRAHEATEKAIGARTSPIARLKAKLQTTESENHAGKELLRAESLNPASLEDRFASLEREERVDRLLDELKQKHQHLLSDGDEHNA